MTAFNKTGITQLIGFLIIISSYCSGQQKKSFDKYFTAGYNFSFLGYAPSRFSNVSGETFKRSREVLYSKDGRGGTTLTGASSFGLNAGFLWQYKHSKNMTAINFLVQQHRNAYVFALPFKKKVTVSKCTGDCDEDDPPVIDTVLRSTGHWTETLNYIYYGISLEHFFYIRDNSLFLGGEKYQYIKLSYGQTAFYRSRGSYIKTGDTDSGYDEKHNMTSATTNVVNPNNYMLGIEIGSRNFSESRKRSLDIGLAYYMPFGSAYSREYKFYEQQPASKPGLSPSFQLKGSENVIFSGATVMLNITYNFNSHIKPRVRDTTDFIKMDEPTSPSPVVNAHKLHELNGRKVKIQEKINVTDTIILADVWDKGKIDGDRISLYLNGNEILHDYTVGREKKQITLHLVPGKNYLVMHALNLGRIPPNTAALELDSNGKLHLIILNSDMKKSGALEIDYKP